MAQTVNGWPVIFHEDYDGPGPHLRKWYFPEGSGLHHHEKYLILRDGAIGFVLMHFFLWFHETIERIDVQKLWDEWGWAVRPVRGQTTGYSNHAGGAAGDVNATAHPRGVCEADQGDPDVGSDQEVLRRPDLGRRLEHPGRHAWRDRSSSLQQGSASRSSAGQDASWSEDSQGESWRQQELPLIHQPVKLVATKRR